MTELSIVVPCYNEEAVLEECVVEIAREAAKAVPLYEILLVDDGSRDRTGEISRSLAEANPAIRAFSKPNGGIGSAVTLGFSHACGRYLTYAPADAQFDPAELPLLLSAIRDADVVIGYKSTFDSYTGWRRLHSRGFRFLLARLFSIESPDLNFIHMYRAEAYPAIRPRSNGSFFHAETIARAVRSGLRVKQIPLTLRARTAGAAKGASPKAVFKILREMASYGWNPTLR